MSNEWERGPAQNVTKYHELYQWGGGSGGLCHIKVGDKIGRFAAKISQILQIFTTKMVIF